MKYLWLFVIICLSTVITASAQQSPVYPNTHSHNDYAQAEPFYHAYKDGFGAIEADVFLVDGKLWVAHSAKELNSERTLKNLYLEPIATALTKDSTRRLTLLVDVKGDSIAILNQLIKELNPLLPLLKGAAPNGRLLILISGNRPLTKVFKTFPDYIYFDENLRHAYTKQELKKIGQISLQYSKYAKWKGVGTLPEADEKALKQVIGKVHAMGKTVRFWDAPDNPNGWATLLKLKVDVIGTDHLDSLTAFMKSSSPPAR